LNYRPDGFKEHDIIQHHFIGALNKKLNEFDLLALGSCVNLRKVSGRDTPIIVWMLWFAAGGKFIALRE
jgi:hypothetical protein